jgi:hypothetical protein
MNCSITVEAGRPVFLPHTIKPPKGIWTADAFKGRFLSITKVLELAHCPGSEFSMTIR